MEYIWVDDPRQSKSNAYPKEDLGYHYGDLCVVGVPKLIKRLQQSSTKFSWQFDLEINGDRYPSQGIISVNQENNLESINLTVISRSDELSLSQLEQAYNIVVGVLDGKIASDISVSEITVSLPRQPKVKKETSSKSKKKA